MTPTIGIIGILVTVAIFLAGIIFKTGHLSARVEELEKWRGSIRQDMHEISERMQELTASVKELSVIVVERTERRQSPR